uniref:G_PROTEIN_RECEP_F1_2 domain-containing protein n=1 Tax=Panagrellus redivivus TaxID=6233 RepID=A0A7E4VC27_PANRE
MDPFYYDPSPTFVKIYSTLLYAIAIATILVTPIFLYVIIYKSSELMSSYRALILAYFPFAFITTFVISISIPIFDFNSYRYHFYDNLFWFKDGSVAFEIFFITVIYTFDMIITDLLLIMLIDRYVVVSKNITTRPNWVIPFWYGIIFITNVIAAVFCIFNNVLSVIDRKSELHEYDFVKVMIVPTSAIFQITRLGGFVAIVILNLKFGRKYAQNASSNVIRLHKTLTQSVIVTILYTTIFTRLPIILVTIAFSTNGVLFLSVVLNMIIVFRSFALLGQMLTTIYLVRGYRSFVLELGKFFCKINHRIVKIDGMPNAIQRQTTTFSLK